MGVCYSNGTGCSEDKKKAFHFYTKAAEMGDTRATRRLGVCYEKGTGCVQDTKKAVLLFTKAADRGDAEAIRCLGDCYENKKKAIGLFKEAVNSKETRFNQNKKETFESYINLAKNGEANALFNLGTCYANGSGCDKNEKAAFRLYSEAAEIGIEKAIHQLAVS